MQSYLWMRPALQVSEAVLLPALPRRTFFDSHFSDRFLPVQTTDNPFRPVPAEGAEADNVALSTYVRPRGSIAGRGVLRAVGLWQSPVGRTARPSFACVPRKGMTCRCRVR